MWWQVFFPGTKRLKEVVQHHLVDEFGHCCLFTFEVDMTICETTYSRYFSWDSSTWETNMPVLFYNFMTY